MELKATSVDVEDGIAILWLDRPQRNNAWTGRMHAEYRYLLAQLDADPAVRAIIVTGRGKAFCVGGDADALSGHASRGGYDPGTPAELARPGTGIAPEFEASFAYQFGLSKLLVAAMNGPAAGVGLALACFTDLRFARAGARFTTAHGPLNLPAEYGLSWLLPRMLGLTRASELLLSSRVFDAEEALALGLVNQVHPAETLLPATRAYVRELLQRVAPESIRQTRWQIYRDLHRDVASAVVDSEALLETMMTQPDFAEGVAAFRERRPPLWGVERD